MGKININGTEINFVNGARIVIKNDRLVIDGKEITVVNDTATIHIYGDVGSIDCKGSVNCNNVKGNVKCGGSINCDDVSGDVIAGGSVNADCIGGNVKAGGSVRI